MEFFRHFDAYGKGMWLTVQITALSYLFGLVIGSLMAVFRVGPVAPLRAVATAYVELLRNTPLLVLLVLLFFGVNQLGFQYSSYVTAIMGLALGDTEFRNFINDVLEESYENGTWAAAWDRTAGAITGEEAPEPPAVDRY